MKKILFSLSLAFLALGVSAQELAYFANWNANNPVKSPEVTSEGVTFRLKADYATQVKLYGNWMENPYGGETIDMVRGENNVWSATIPLPPPELYTYFFVVDGLRTIDPENSMLQRDGTTFIPMFIVPGERSENYYDANHHGTVSFSWYDSKLLGISRRVCVYTPYGYENNPKKKYPVLYLLHGAGGDEEAWILMGRAAQILDNLIEKGLAEPMIVVMPNGNPGQSAARSLNIPEKQLNLRSEENRNIYVRSLCTEIVPFIEKNFRTIAKPSGRAIGGLSMGGGHTIAATNLYPEMFDYVCPMSAAGSSTPEQLATLKKAGVKYYLLACGKTDFLFQGAEEMHQKLVDQGFEHEYLVSEGGHTWPNWRLYLNTFAQKIFK